MMAAMTRGDDTEARPDPDGFESLVAADRAKWEAWLAEDGVTPP